MYTYIDIYIDISYAVNPPDSLCTMPTRSRRSYKPNRCPDIGIYRFT